MLPAAVAYFFLLVAFLLAAFLVAGFLAAAFFVVAAMCLFSLVRTATQLLQLTNV
jgi:hypothetical protein